MSRPLITPQAAALSPLSRVSALCRDSNDDTFFPTSILGVAIAQFVCRNCDVAAECLEQAELRGEESGVWGGKLYG